MEHAIASKLRLIVTLLYLSSLSPALLAYEAPPLEPGFESLFDGKEISKHFHVKGKKSSWTVVDGIIVASSGGNRLISKKAYTNYVLKLEWKIAEGGNSGVFVNVPSPDDPQPWVSGYEVQISDERPRRKPIHATGALYNRAPTTALVIEPNVWHEFAITALGDNLQVKLDGKLVSNGNPATHPVMKDLPTSGHVGVQDYHGANGKTVEYRNIRIQALNTDGTIQGFKSLTASSNDWRKIKTGHGTGGIWQYEDGVWSGEQDPPGSGNGGILIYNEKFSDFEVSFETKPDWGVCSGFFLRSTEKGQCYQVMVDYHHRNGNIGGLYGEGTGGFVQRSYKLDANKDLVALEKVQGTPPPIPFEEKEWSRYWNKEGWNQIRARIVGNPPRVESWVNGAYMSDLQDDQNRIPHAGHIGIQVHGGKGWPKGAKVHFRNIQVRPLKKTAK